MVSTRRIALYLISSVTGCRALEGVTLQLVCQMEALFEENMMHLQEVPPCVIELLDICRALATLLLHTTVMRADFPTRK